MSSEFFILVIIQSAGLPRNQIRRTIEINLLQMMGKEEIPEPVKPINDEYILWRESMLLIWMRVGQLRWM